jgi:SAM-dependent methyltransferase
MKEPKNYWDYLVKDSQGKYHDLYQMGPQSHRLYLLDLLKEKNVKSVLDTGCGTAPIYQLIKNNPAWDFIYKGTDYSEGMIESCQFNFPDGNFEVQDNRMLKEKDNSWDCVLMMHVLDHLDDYEAAIIEAARVAKKYVLIVLWRGINYTPGAVNNLNNKSRISREEGEPDWEDTHLQDYAWEPLAAAFQKAGLVIEQKEEGEVVNKEGRYNTLILLKKI